MFIREIDKQYPMTAAQIIADHPHTSFPVPFALPDGYAHVLEALPPAFNPTTHRLAEQAPQLIGSEWHQVRTVVEMTAEERAAYVESTRPPVPAEVPRWAGRLALKRHALNGGALVLLAPDETRPDNFLARASEWRETLPPGELADRVDAALDDAKDWLRGSTTVATLADILGLNGAQVDALFVWAGGQEV